MSSRFDPQSGWLANTRPFSREESRAALKAWLPWRFNPHSCQECGAARQDGWLRKNARRYEARR